MPYNYSKLLGRITELFGTQSKFAEAMKISKHTISAKLNGKSEWKQPEISKACQLLNIPIREIHAYFFVLRVQYS